MRSIELFSGAGGLALGLEQAGFEHVALVERDRNACSTLRLNRPHWNLIQEDARNIRFSDFAPVDLVAGGPPCQPFSIGGKARGCNDERDMFPEAVRAVRELRPKAFLFENVRGLLRRVFHEYVEYIRLQLTYPEFPVSQNLDWQTNLRRLQRHNTSEHRFIGLAYQVTIHLVDAADYGVPQRRQRVFLIGFRSDLDAKWSFPPAVASYEQLLRDKYVTKTYWKEHGLKAPDEPPAALRARVERLTQEMIFCPARRWRTVRDALAGLPNPGPSCGIANHAPQPGAKAYPGHTGSVWDEPAKALKAGDHGVPGGENMLNEGPGLVRYFTVRESARIQTFPDDFVISGSWTESMRQLGNAVPVALARAVATSVRKHLSRFCAQKTNV